MIVRRTGIATGLVALITACGSEPVPTTTVQQGTHNDGGYVSFSCEVDIQTLEDAGEIVEIDPSEIYVHDGDTVDYRDKTYRFSAVDAAEIGNGRWPDQYGLDEYSNVNYGQLGRDFVKNAFESAQRVWHVRGTADPNAQRTDDNGRFLGYFILDSQLLPCQLVIEGLVYENVSYYYRGRTPPHLAQIVLAASKEVGQPHFMRPDLYKKKYE